MFDDVVVVYKFLGDLMFYVTGDQDENEVRPELDAGCRAGGSLGTQQPCSVSPVTAVQRDPPEMRPSSAYATVACLVWPAKGPLVILAPP